MHMRTTGTYRDLRAINFYRREDFQIQCEGLDKLTGEKDYVMIWQRNFREEER